MAVQGFQQFTMGSGDENIGGGKTRRWKGETGHTYRFSFLWYEGSEDKNPNLGTAEEPKAPNFVGAPISYIPGVGFIVNNGPEITKLAGGEPPKTKVGTIVAVWPIKADGKPDTNRISSGDVEVAAFVFSGDKYKTLVQINREFPFALHDITVKCDDAQYQKLIFQPCKENLLRKFLDGGDKGKALMDPILSAVAQIIPNIQGELGRVMTVEQIRAKLVGGSVGSAVSGPVANVTGDLDGLVADLLDH